MIMVGMDSVLGTLTSGIWKPNSIDANLEFIKFETTLEVVSIVAR